MADQPFDWTVGNAKAQIGDQFQMTFGEAISATMGISAQLIVGSDATIVCDPTDLLSYIPGWQAVVSPLIHKLVGRQKVFLAGNNTYTLGHLRNLTLASQENITLGTAARNSVLYWARCANLATLLLMLEFGGTAPKLAVSGDNWETRLAESGPPFLFAVLVLVFVLMWKFGAITETIARVEDNASDSEESENTPVISGNVSTLRTASTDN